MRLQYIKILMCMAGIVLCINLMACSRGANQEEKIEILLAEKTKEPVCDSFYLNIAGNHEVSAFVLTGTKEKESTETSQINFQGSLWYFDGQNCTLVKDGIEAYDYEPEILDYGNVKHLLLRTGSSLPGSAVSYIWAVREHKPELVLETPNACFTDNGQLAIVRTFISNSAQGRIWQRYYLYWDDEKQCYREYTGKEIAESEFLEYENAQEMKDSVETAIKEELSNVCEMDAIDKIETNYIKRDNGIINVNYSIFCGENVYYRYSILTEKDGAIQPGIVPEHYGMYEWGYISETGGFEPE